MVLGGASLGGGIAMDFAVQHPEARETAPLVMAGKCVKKVGKSMGNPWEILGNPHENMGNI
jgi:pimeloyl-ACP methyl ester carboxylesterase